MYTYCFLTYWETYNTCLRVILGWMLFKVVFGRGSIRVFAANVGNPYYESTIMVHGTHTHTHARTHARTHTHTHFSEKNFRKPGSCPQLAGLKNRIHAQ